jgi:two-component system, NarL family, sensor kinase
VGVTAIVTTAGEGTVESAGPVAILRQAECDAVARHDTIEAAMARLNTLLELQSARIAGVLHDDVSQVLAAAHLAIDEIAGESPAAVQRRLHKIRRHLHEVAEQLRRISHDLHPGILEDVGVADAIRFISRAFTRRTGVQLTLSLHLDQPCPPATGAVVYRLVEEGLTNISAHARATAASIAIARDGSRIVCTISDDGVGFDVEAVVARTADHGLGLMLTRGRLEAIGGTLDVTSAPQHGTRLCAVIPVEI